MMNEWIISSSVLIGLVLLGRFLLRGKISLRLQYGLWAVALVRLLLPVQIFTSDFGAGSIARDVDISAPVRQVYVSANEDRYQREYDEAYRQVVARYESASEHVDPIVIEKEAADLAEKAVELDLTQLLLSLWFAGMVVMTSVICSCNVHLGCQLKRRRWDLDVPDSLLRVYVTEAVPTPCIFGFFRPAIYLTPEAAKDGQVRAHVLEHELTHYRHLDHIWSVLRSVCLVLHWYNPLVWAAAKVSRADAELACDEGALARLGEEARGDYGRTLIGLTCADHIGSVLFTATTMTGSAGSIRERIRLLMQRPRNTVLTLTAVALLVTLIVGCTFAGAPETTTPGVNLDDLAGSDWDCFLPETRPPAVDNDMSYHGHELPIPDDLTRTDLSYALSMERAMEDYAGKNPRKLTAEEIVQVRDAFASTVYDAERDEYSATAVAAFFTSYYDDVTELDLAEFLRYFPASGEATEEEFQLLHQKYGAGFDWAEHPTLQNMPVPVHRYAITDIDKVLRRYANLPFQELQFKDTVYHLEETDCYYNFTSDFGPGAFVCVDGFVYDGGAVLYSEGAALFLTETLGHYSIRAHLPLMGYEGGGTVSRSDSFNADGLLVYPGTQWGMTEAQLLKALDIQEYGTFSGMRGIHLPDTDFCGYPASIGFYFDQYRTDTEWGLFGVMVRFEKEADFTAVRAILMEQLGSPDSQNSGISFDLWRSDVRVEELVSAAAYEQYQQTHSVSLTGNNADGAATTVSCYGPGNPDLENTVCFEGWLTTALQIEASLAPSQGADFGTVAYFDALLNPQMYRTEADWYPLALNSFYETPAQIDLYQLFYNGIPGADNTLTAAERAFLNTCPGYEPEYDLDRIPAAEMDRVLQAYFGTTLEQTEGIGLEKFLYWKEQDCYYHCHSDSNLFFVEIVHCEEVKDRLWRIVYTTQQGGSQVVTLMQVNSGWQVIANIVAE